MKREEQPDEECIEETIKKTKEVYLKTGKKRAEKAIYTEQKLTKKKLCSKKKKKSNEQRCIKSRTAIRSTRINIFIGM